MSPTIRCLFFGFMLGPMALAGAQTSAPVLPAQAAPAADPAGTGPDTDSIRRARAELKAALSRQERECRGGFWVNSCLKDAQEAFRRDVAELDQIERAIEAQRRQQRAQQAQERVRHKEQTLEGRRAPLASPMTDAEIEQRLELARGERAEQARERLSQQQLRQAVVDQRNQAREDAARQQQERAGRSRTAGSDGPAPSAGSVGTPPQPAR